MPTQNDVRQSLKVLPDTLMEAYDKIYQRILAQKGSARQLALSAFRWIQSSYEPLRSETLLDAITVEIGCSGEFSRNNTVNANNLLKVCQNLLILDETLNVFRLAHLSVDEYLETKLPKIASHTESAKVCLSLLCNPHYWNRYDRTLSTSEGDYEGRHLLLYSITFWPWHFSHCEAANDTMEILSQKFMSETNYRNWLLYHQSVVRVDPWTRDPFWRKIAAFVDHENDAPIFSACVFGLTRTFEVLKSRMDVDAAWLSWLLADASNFGYLEIARLLIDGGADVSAADDVELTPLHCASYTGHQAIARLLIDRGANVSAAKKDGRTPLHLALESRHEAIARLLIESGANVSAADEDGATPLRMAVANGDEAVVWLLINRGAEVSATDEDGGTPLHLAARYGREAVARLLIDCGADVSAADDYGCTPVHHALGSGHEAVARLLIDGGADILATDEYSLSPLHHASDSGDDGMSRLLRDRGSIWRQLTATPTPTSSL
jgi:ankyrin repeat protein